MEDGLVAIHESNYSGREINDEEGSPHSINDFD